MAEWKEIEPRLTPMTRIRTSPHFVTFKGHRYDMDSRVHLAASMEPEQTHCPLPDNQAEEELLRATRHLWTLFGKGYGKSGWADQDNAMARAAETKRLGELTSEEFDHLAWHAMCWDQSPEAIQYFLPRMLDDLAYRKQRRMDGAMLMLAFIDAGWKQWPSHQAEAVRRWFAAWWDAAMWFPDSPIDGRSIRSAARERDVVSILPLLGLLEFDLPSLLHAWPGHPSPHRLSHLIRLIEDFKWNTLDGTIPDWSRLWGNVGVHIDTQNAVVSWLRSKPIHDWLEAAFFAATDDKERTRISTAMLMAFPSPLDHGGE